MLDGDHFVVNGHKVWTTNGHFADWMFALLRTDPDAKPKQAGISMLLIDLKSPGVTVRPIQTIRGDAEFAEEFFVDVRVPRENLLGPLNEGWRVANKLLGSERFTTGHPRNAAVLLNKARQVAELTGASRAAGFRQKLAALEIDLLAFSAYYRHAAEPARARQGARLDGAGDQDRRRRIGPARLRASGRGGGSVRAAGSRTCGSATTRSIRPARCSRCGG